MKTINRRRFLKNSATVAAAAFSLPAYSWARVPGANDAIRVGIVGFNGRGADHIGGMRGLAGKNVRIVALCDVDKKILTAGCESFSQRSEQVGAFSDIRKLLEQDDLDAVTVATPNHWHALATIWAVQAGKDVYVEKPVCHEVWEGNQTVQAARKYKRIVQAGTQSRSSHAIKEAIEWVRAGNLGKILLARGLCYKPRTSIGKVDGPQPPPEDVDYNLWCGPAPMAPIRRKRFHYDWHWIWNYGNGDLGNQGIHQMDIARWFLGEKELSPRVWSLGGRLGYIDDGTTPNTQIVFHDYEKAPLIFEVRGLPRSKDEKDMDNLMSAAGGTLKGEDIPRFRGKGVGVIIECEGGSVVVPDYSNAYAYEKKGDIIKQFSGSESHHGNFLKAVHSRNYKDLNADILEGHLSSSLCHTGNISYRLGHTDRPEKIREAIKADRGATDTFDRMAAHLEANGVDITKDKLALGVVLKMDPKTEKFRGNGKANALLTRNYRKPYVVPEKVA